MVRTVAVAALVVLAVGLLLIGVYSGASGRLPAGAIQWTREPARIRIAGLAGATVAIGILVIAWQLAGR